MTIPLTTREIGIYKGNGVAQDNPACYKRCNSHFFVDGMGFYERKLNRLHGFMTFKAVKIIGFHCIPEVEIKPAGRVVAAVQVVVSSAQKIIHIRL